MIENEEKKQKSLIRTEEALIQCDLYFSVSFFFDWHSTWWLISIRWISQAEEIYSTMIEREGANGGETGFQNRKIKWRKIVAKSCCCVEMCRLRKHNKNSMHATVYSRTMAVWERQRFKWTIFVHTPRAFVCIRLDFYVSRCPHNACACAKNFHK